MTFPRPNPFQKKKAGLVSSPRRHEDLRVERQEQPHGEAGTRFSLEKVAAKICEGRIHPDVRAWTTKVLKEAGNPRGPKARAKALLEAVRKQSGWVPDPTDSEYIAGAHLTLGDGTKPPFFALGDCDDLTVALGSAVLAPVMYLAAAQSVGAVAAVVGHAYDESQMIVHVLGAIWDGKWWYVDPSLKDMPFGECRPFTRERVYLVPSKELLCDKTVCLRPGGAASGPPPAPRRGDFVSVDGVPGVDDEPSEDATLLDTCDLTGVCHIAATHKRPETKAEIENGALLNAWMDLAPNASSPLSWCSINPPVRGDVAAEDLQRPWRDLPDDGDGRAAIIPGSGFLRTRK